MKVAVTGASGALGTYVLRALVQRDHDVLCVSRNAPRVDVPFFEGDIRDEEGLRRAFGGCDAVVHMAAVPGPRWTTPADLMGVNVVGSTVVAEAALGAGVATLVLASSAAATGFSFQSSRIVPSYLPIDEDHPDAAQDIYGVSKRSAEEVFLRHARAKEVRAVCLRVAFSWFIDSAGVSEAMGSAGWARELTSETLWERYRGLVTARVETAPGRPGPPPPSNLLWAYVDARDAARAFCLAVEDGTGSSGTFLVAAGDTCSMLPTQELVETHYPDVSYEPGTERFSSLLSTERAARAFGYEPVHSWREGDFAEWAGSALRPPDG